jgi:uncharacterized membrane protein
VSHRHWDLTAIMALAVVAMIAVMVEQPLLRLLSGAPLVLWLPGYALTAAIFAEGKLSLPLRFVLNLGVSLAVTVLGGFVLNLTSWGLGPVSWAIWLGGATILAAGFALLRRNGGWILHTQADRLDLSRTQASLIGAALIVMVGAVGMARWGAMEAPSTPFTQLWATPVMRANGEAIQIGIYNGEGNTETYALQVKIGDELIYGWSALMLAQDQRWQQIVQLPAEVAPDRSVEVQIYRTAAPDHLYRSVVLRQESNEER